VRECWESGRHDELKETGSSIKRGDGSLGGVGKLFKGVGIGE